MKRLLWLLPAILLLAACESMPWSENPETAVKQQWVAGCKAADSNIRTATTLYRAGQLSESAADSIDDVVDLYEVVCTGDPPDPGVPIQSIVVRALAAKVCPSLAPSSTDDWALTLVDAAACVAEGALLAGVQ